MFSYLILGLGGLLLGAIVYRYDMHEREPWWMLVLAALAGGLTMWGAFELVLLLRDLVGASDHSFFQAVLSGILGEFAKLAIPVAVLLLMKKNFNDPMDGLIYGSLAGLGAALFEAAWLQWFANSDGANTFSGYGPSAMRLLMHTLWGGIVGSALGLIVMKKPWRKTLTKRVGIVMLVHFAWDFFIGFVDEPSTWRLLLMAVLIGATVCWYGLLVVQANKWSRSLHAPQSKQRLVGRIVKMLITRRFR